MNIVFDPRPGEIYDIFLSLWLANNYEYAQEEKRNHGLDEDTNFEKKIKSIILEKSINPNKLSRYFQKEIEPSQTISLSSLWDNPTVNQYLEFIKHADEYKIRELIVKLIMNNEVNENEANVEMIVSSNSSLLEYIKNKDINVSLKWEIFCILDNTESYLKEFTEFINKYLNAYKRLCKERKKEIDIFNNEFKKNLEEGGINYLNEFTNKFVDFDTYDNIFITSSALIGLSVNMEPEKKSCYVLVGPRTKDIIKIASQKDEFEKNILMLKNISDSTRFKIIKKLVERDHFGLELAQHFGLNKATISHHMNFLLLSGVVRVERKEHKAYYSLNKDELRNIIQFLSKELKL